MPASSARWTTRRVASKSMRPPKLLQPRPTSDTRRPERPRFLISIASPKVCSCRDCRAGGGNEILYFHRRATALAFDCAEDERGCLKVLLDPRLHRRAAGAPGRELFDQPMIDPLGLRQKRDLLSLSFTMLLAPDVLTHEDLEVAMREDRRSQLPVDP